MSVPVQLSDIRDVVAGQAPFPYLLTTSDDATPHAVAITPVLGDDTISVDAGHRSCANASTHPNVSLLWPPATFDDYSLIVDGVAAVDGSVVVVKPGRALRHRPAPGGGNDCIQLPLQ